MRNITTALCVNDRQIRNSRHREHRNRHYKRRRGPAPDTICLLWQSTGASKLPMPIPTSSITIRTLVIVLLRPNCVRPRGVDNKNLQRAGEPEKGLGENRIGKQRIAAGLSKRNYRFPQAPARENGPVARRREIWGQKMISQTL